MGFQRGRKQRGVARPQRTDDEADEALSAVGDLLAAGDVHRGREHRFRKRGHLHVHDVGDTALVADHVLGSRVLAPDVDPAQFQGECGHDGEISSVGEVGGRRGCLQPKPR